MGLMGVGKSTIGRRLAARLTLPFADTDREVEAAAGMTVSDIFSERGEAAFRATEACALQRLLEGPRLVLATGGGAVLDPVSRRLLKDHAVTVWLRADLEAVARRVRRRDTRPLLRGRDPLTALKALAEVRYPLYATADVTVDLTALSRRQAADSVLSALERHAAAQPLACRA